MVAPTGGAEARPDRRPIESPGAGRERRAGLPSRLEAGRLHPIAVRLAGPCLACRPPPRRGGRGGSAEGLLGGGRRGRPDAGLAAPPEREQARPVPRGQPRQAGSLGSDEERDRRRHARLPRHRRGRREGPVLFAEGIGVTRWPPASSIAELPCFMPPS